MQRAFALLLLVVLACALLPHTTGLECLDGTGMALPTAQPADCANAMALSKYAGGSRRVARVRACLPALTPGITRQGRT